MSKHLGMSNTFQVRQLTYTFTCPATVLHACHVSRLTNKESLVIHIVGARTAEVDDAPAWSLITSYLPTLKSLTLVMIGPELGGDDLPSSFNFKTDSETAIKFVMVKADYRSYAKSKQFREPDLVAALNCGFIFYTSWDSSLDPMLRPSGAPLVFTEYYQQDCQLNLEKLQKNTRKKLAIVTEPSANPFCSRSAFTKKLSAHIFCINKYFILQVCCKNSCWFWVEKIWKKECINV